MKSIVRMTTEATVAPSDNVLWSNNSDGQPRGRRHEGIRTVGTLDWYADGELLVLTAVFVGRRQRLRIDRYRGTEREPSWGEKGNKKIEASI